MLQTNKRLNDPICLSHGTLEVREHPEAMRFYRDFLGIGCERHCMPAMNIFHAGDWAIACVMAGKGKHAQGPENAWILNMSSPEDVDRARDSAVKYKELFDIQEILPIQADDGTRSFLLQDLDLNWWEFRYEAGDVGRWVDAAFERGDVV